MKRLASLMMAIVILLSFGNGGFANSELINNGNITINEETTFVSDSDVTFDVSEMVEGDIITAYITKDGKVIIDYENGLLSQTSLSRITAEHLFSLKLATAKPTIWVEHPMVAAPAGRPESPKIIDKAAELMGRVRAIPITTDITMPIKNG